MRVQFDMSNDAVAYIDDVKAKTGAASRADVLRSAIAALTWLVEKAETNHAVIAVKRGQDDEPPKELAMPILDAARRHGSRSQPVPIGAMAKDAEVSTSPRSEES